MKNKLSVSTLAFQDWELEDAIHACETCGIDAMEIRMGFHSWSKLELPDSTYEKIYEKLSAHGLAVSDLGTSIRMIGYTEEGLRELERCSQIANILHCRGLRVMLGNKHKKRSDVVPPIDYEGLVRWLRAADVILEKYGTQIWIETHDEFATGKSQRELLNQYPFRHIHSLWDIMHPLEAGEPPEETLRYMNKDLVHIHIKDGLPWEDPDRSSWKYTKIGAGIVPIRDIVNLVLEAGYQGYFSLEWESAWRQEIRGDGFEIPDMLCDFSRLMNDIS